MTNRTARFPVGLTFTHYARKHNNKLTIDDILTTTNLAGEVVRIEYVVSHEFMGQRLTETMIDPAIARSLTNEQLAQFVKQ